MILCHGARTLNPAILNPKARRPIPIGSRVVPSWDYLMGPYKVIRKGDYYGAYGYRRKDFLEGFGVSGGVNPEP